MTKYLRNYYKQTTFWLKLTWNHFHYSIDSSFNTFQKNDKEISIFFGVKIAIIVLDLSSNKLDKFQRHLSFLLESILLMDYSQLVNRLQVPRDKNIFRLILPLYFFCWPRVLNLQGRRKVCKSGGASSNVVVIICPSWLR